MESTQLRAASYQKKVMKLLFLLLGKGNFQFRRKYDKFVSIYDNIIRMHVSFLFFSFSLFAIVVMWDKVFRHNP